MSFKCHTQNTLKLQILGFKKYIEYCRRQHFLGFFYFCDKKIHVSRSGDTTVLPNKTKFSELL